MPKKNPNKNKASIDKRKFSIDNSTDNKIDNKKRKIITDSEEEKEEGKEEGKEEEKEIKKNEIKYPKDFSSDLSVSTDKTEENIKKGKGKRKKNKSVTKDINKKNVKGKQKRYSTSIKEIKKEKKNDDSKEKKKKGKNKNMKEDIEMRDDTHNNEILLKEKYSFAFLLFNIGIYTKNKYIYIHCFNHLLNFSFISDDFCKEILTISNINLIYAKLIYFYPIFNLNNFDNFNSVQKVESFYMGGQIFRFFGNLYISSSNNEVFKQIDFYKKIIDLIFILNIDEINSKYNIIYFEFLETLIWILTLFSEKEENFKYEYKIELSKIIPKFLDDIKLLYFSKSFDIIEKILELFTILSDDNPDLIKKFVEGNGFQILLDLIISLFDENINNDVNQKLYKNIIDKILDILNTIISKETKYFKNFNDYSTLSIVIEKLIINFNPKNDFKQQRKLIKILSNLSLFNDINDIIAKILLNKNIIKELFQNYYLYHKLDIIVFISNVIEKQSKNVRDFFIENGAFEIIKNNICNDICKDNRIIKLSIKILYQIIKEEKSYDIKLLFEKIYNTAIPDKNKNLVNDNNINNNLDNDIFINKSNEKISDIFNNLINDFEKYEKTLDFYFN